MRNYSMNFIVKLTGILNIFIISFIIVATVGDIPYQIVCIIGLIINIYIVIYSFIARFTIYEDKLIFKKPFKLVEIYWNEIGLISTWEFRKNKYNVYLTPKVVKESSSFKTPIMINWQFNNHKELVKEIIANCKENVYMCVEEEVYKAIKD